MFHPEGPSLFQLARQALSSTDRGYDLLAPRFDHTPFRTPDDLLDALVPWLAPDGSVASAADLCTGTGAALRVLRPLCRDRLVGVDRSRGMLDVARSRELPGSAPLTLLNQDALTFDGSGFDLVTCFGAHGHIVPRDQPRFAHVVYDALRPGGRYVCLTAVMPTPLQPAWWMARSFNAVMRVRNAVLKPEFIMYYLLFTADHATRVLSDAGFDVHIDRDVLPHPYRRLHVLTATRPG